MIKKSEISSHLNEIAFIKVNLPLNLDAFGGWMQSQLIS